MFCAMATLIDRCKTEGIVDVFQVVKALRTSKPSAVPTMVSAVIGANPQSGSFVCLPFCWTSSQQGFILSY